MYRMILGSVMLAGLVGGALLVPAPKAEASKPFMTVTKMACAKCHTGGTKGTDKDLTACGKECLEHLTKKHGYKRGKTEAEQKANAEKMLKDFKCSK
jgi:hypothetical protein